MGKIDSGLTPIYPRSIYYFMFEAKNKFENHRLDICMNNNSNILKKNDIKNWWIYNDMNKYT